MGHITNDMKVASITTDLSSWHPLQQSEHNLAPSSAIPMTPMSQADIKKANVQQLGHGSPENVNITPEQLDEQKSKLTPIKVAATPFVNLMSIQRSRPCTSTQFVDFARATRDQLTQLASTSAGQELFMALDYQSIPTLQTVCGPTPQDPPQQMYLRMPLQHGTYLTNPDFTRPGIEENTYSWHPEGQLHFNADGSIKHAGLGSSTTVTHQPDLLQRAADPKHGLLDDKNVLRSIIDIEDAGSYDSATALGHELIHAAHALNGLSDFRLREDGLQRGEQYTVGLADGKTREFQNIPTENMLRKGLNEQYYQDSGMIKPIPMRDKYGGKVIDEAEAQALIAKANATADSSTPEQKD